MQQTTRLMPNPMQAHLRKAPRAVICVKLLGCNPACPVLRHSKQPQTTIIHVPHSRVCISCIHALCMSLDALLVCQYESAPQGSILPPEVIIYLTVQTMVKQH